MYICSEIKHVSLPNVSQCTIRPKAFFQVLRSTVERRTKYQIGDLWLGEPKNNIYSEIKYKVFLCQKLPKALFAQKLFSRTQENWSVKNNKLNWPVFVGYAKNKCLFSSKFRHMYIDNIDRLNLTCDGARDRLRYTISHIHNRFLSLDTFSLDLQRC